MRKISLLSAIALGALVAGCAQSGNTAMNAPECDLLPADAYMQAVDQGKCDLDVNTAAGGEPRSFDPDKSHEGKDDSDDGGDDGDDGHEPDPEPDPDPEDGGTAPSTAPDSI